MSAPADLRVSVIIPAYNVEDVVARAVDSALSQTYPAREVIVVDDGSTDATARILAAYADQIRVIPQSNQGMSSARNRGLAEAQGECVAFLDADDRWLPEKLERQMQLMSEQPGIGFCSTATQVEDLAGRALGLWDCPSIERSALHTIFARTAAIAGSASSVALRREVIARAGPFDESLRGLEDTDMWMRCAAITGYACLHEPLTVITRRPASVSRNLEHMRAATFRVLRKNRRLLPETDRYTFWQAAYARLLTDIAKWEYRSGHRSRAVWHLLEALARSPVRTGRQSLGLLLAMMSGARL
jgi:glycosyltransferase involved in cell wall biosynthesis